VRRALAAAAIGVALAAAGCGGDDVKTFKDPHGKIDVDEGKTFAIELKVNSGVGYDWKAVGLPAGIALVELKKTSTDYPDENRAGESGTKRFEYRARARGIQTITFQRYFRGKLDERRNVNVSIGSG
jgi:predicted secreted protein